jgi:hypothetical protein
MKEYRWRLDSEKTEFRFWTANIVASGVEREAFVHCLIR